MALAVVLFGSANAFALADGEAPALLVRHTVFGDGFGVGNTLMNHDGTQNFELRTLGSQQNVANFRMAPDAVVERAFLFWSGSTDPVFGVDRDLDFTLPNGQFFNDLSVDFPVAGEPPSALNRCVSRNNVGQTAMGFFSCRREVTTLLQNLGPGGATGTYTVNDVDALAGNCAVDPFCQAAYAGWALVVVWDSPTEPVRRDVVLYDAFFAADEQTGPFSSGLSPFFNLDNFLVGGDGEGELTFMGFEGDAQLGTPPQDSPLINPPQNFCPTCADFIEVQSTTGAGSARLTDPNNAAGNIFNGSNNSSGGPHPGLDIDAFNIGASGNGILSVGDTSLRMRVGSGDGVPGGQAGGGELVFLGFTLLTLDTLSPRFTNAGTEKVVLETTAGPGETLNYILRVENDGSSNATNTIVRDQLPPGVTYVAGSTTNTCGVASNDIAGTSPVLRPAGLNISTISIGERCEIRFRAEINAGVADGTVLQNFFQVQADGVDPVTVGPATTVIEGVSLATPTKAVSVLGGGPATPGATLIYTIRVTNTGGRDAPDVAIQDVLPPEIEFVSTIASPPGSTDASAGGTISVQNIDIDQGEFASFTFAATVRPGTPAGAIILNQATVTQASLPGPLLTDDPAQPGAQDETTVVVESDISLGLSTKSVTIDGGAPAEPGGTLTYTITVLQSGTAPALVIIDDDLPAFVNGCTMVSTPPGSFVSCAPGGANGTGRVEGAVPVTAGIPAAIVFRVGIDAAAPDGTLIQNAARLVPQGDAPATFTAISPTVEVFARPVFLTSTKIALDQNGGDARPGDIIRYTVVATNSGSIPATNLVVTDAAPAALEVLTADAGGVIAGQSVTWTLPTLAVGASVLLSFDARIRAGTPNGTAISNVAQLAADAPASPFTTAPATIIVTATPSLVVEKTVVDTTPAPFRPGDIVTYTMAIRNDGDGAANNVVLRDTPDPSFAESILTAGGRIDAGQIVFDDVTIGALTQVAPGATVSVTFDARLRSSLPNATVVNNQAFTTANEVVVAVASDDPATPAPADPTQFTIVSAAVVTMQKVFFDVDGGATLPGDRVEIRLTLENTGDAPATDLVIRDPLDPLLTFVSSTTGGTLQGADVVFSSVTNAALAALEPGAPLEIAFLADVAFPLADGTLIANQATASSPVLLDVPSDDPATPPVGDPTVLRVESRPVFDDAEKTVVDVDGDGIFEPQDRVRYTIVFENTGSEDALNVVINDVIAPGLVNVVPEAGGQFAAGSVTWTAATNPQLALVAVGDRITLAFQADIARPLPNNFNIDNQAFISADNAVAVPTDDPTTAALDDPTSIVVISNPRLIVEKTVLDGNGGVVEPGDTLLYTIRIRNDGDRAADGVEIRDPVDVSLTNAIADNGGNLAFGEIEWTAATTPGLASLGIDQQIVVGFSAVVLSPLTNGTLIENQAVVGIAEVGVPGAPFLSDDPTTATPDDPTIVQVVSAANLTTSTLESFDEVGAPINTANPGDLIRYVSRISNTGNESATNVVVTFPIPGELQVEAAPGGIIVPGVVTFPPGGTPTLASIAPGETVEVFFEARVVFPLDNGAEIRVQGAINADGLAAPFVTDDPSTANASDDTLVTVVSQTDLSGFIKTVADLGPAPFEPGDTVQYTLTVTNTGDAPARNVVVRDPLPPELEFVSSTSGGTFVGGEVVFTQAAEPDLALVQPGDTPIVLRFEARVVDGLVAGSFVANQANVTPNGGVATLSDDPATVAIDDTTRFEIVTVPRLTMTKDLNGPTGRIFAPGDLATYSFVLTSSGTGATGGFDFLDVVPAPLDAVSTTGGIAFNGATRAATATFGSLAPGQSVTFSISGTIAAGTPNGTRLENQAQVQGIDLGLVQSDDPTTPAPDDQTVGIVEATPNVSASKTATDENGGTILPGDVMRFDIALRNDGNGAATDVQVLDVLDPNLEIVEVLDGGAVTLNAVTWTGDGTPALANFAPGATLTVRVRARVSVNVEDGTAIPNQAEVRSPTFDAPVLSDDPSTVAANDPTIIVVAAPRLVFEKRLVDLGGAGPLRPGATIRYDLVIRNAGSAAASAVIVTDVIPLQLTDVTAGEGGVISNGEARWDETTTPALGSLGVNATTTLTLNATVDPLATGGTIVRNQAEVSAREVGTPVRSDDPTTPEEQDATIRVVEAEETFTGEVALFDAISGLPILTPVIPDQRVRGRATFRNTGTQTAQALVLRVPFAGTRFRIDEATEGGIVDVDEVRWTASQNEAFRFVAPGDEITVEFVGAIANPIPDGVTIDVIATAESASNQGEIWTFGPAQMLVRSRPDLSASTKEITDDNGGLVEPGDVLTYRITVINAGGAEASEVVLLDPTPSGTEYLPGTAELRGVPVADNAGANPFASGLGIGDLSAGRSAVARFQVRVSLTSLRGVRIENQAILRATNSSDAVTDNPATPLVIGDATVAIVGGGPTLVASKTASVDVVAPGDTVTYQVAVENGGSDLTEDVIVRDVIRAPGTYVANSVFVDGNASTDAADGDPVTVTITAAGAEIEVRRDVLEAGEGVSIVYGVVAGPGTALTNQATVSSREVPSLQTDSDPAVPGVQPSVIPISGGRSILIDPDTMELRDENGGLLEAGDSVIGRAVLRNRSSEAILVTAFVVDISQGFVVGAADVLDDRFDLVTAPTTQIVLGAGNAFEVEANGTFSLPFRGTVAADALRGDAVRAAGRSSLATLDGTIAQAADLGRAELIVGLMPGTSAIAGTVFLDNGDRNDTFSPAAAPNGDGDRRAIGFQVLAFLEGQPSTEPVKTSVTDESGRYELSPLPAGNYRFELRSASGATFRDVDVGAIQGGISDAERHLRIDPSGALYNAFTFEPLRGQRVVLYLDDGDADLENDIQVAESALLPGQQNQVTTTQGLYRFDPPPGQYRIGVETNSQLLSWPSREIAFETAGADHPLGAVAEPADNGTIVAHPIPDAGLDRTYFLRFNLDAALPPVLNNHIPVDSLRDQVRIQKTANRRRLTIGDIVAYTVRIENRANEGVPLSAGGVEIIDTLPQGFRLIDNAWRLDRIDVDGVGQQRRVTQSNVTVSGSRVLRFGTFPLQGETTYELRYQVVVGPGARFGDADNRAALRTGLGAVPITEDALARVKVIADQTFDLGSLRAKVFCDDDADGIQGPGELGVGGARVYLDTGHFAEADLYGKLHFSAIPPGTHLVKLDERTLPPGTTLRGDPRQNFYLSRGLPAQVSYAAQCEFVTHRDPVLTLHEQVYRGPKAPTTATREVAVEAALNTGELTLDGVVLAPIVVGLGVAREGEEPTYGLAPGPNLARPKAGALSERLVFSPRADTSRAIIGWQLTVQRDRVKPAAAASDGDAGVVSAAFAVGGADTTTPAAPVEAKSPALIPDVLGQLAAGASLIDAGTAIVDAGTAIVDAGATDASRIDSAPMDGGRDAGGPEAGGDVDPADASEIVESEAVYVFAGEGPPPRRIEWDGKDPNGAFVLQEGARYGAVFSFVLEGGDEAYSPTRPFGIATGEPVSVEPTEPPYRASINELKGILFTRRGNPTRRMRTFLDETAAALKIAEGGEKSVLVEVHTDPKGDAAVALTSTRAVRIADELEKRGVARPRIEAVGAGDTRPQRPNLRSRDRKTNRRIEISIRVPNTRFADIAPAAAATNAKINDGAFSPDAAGRVAQKIEVDIGSPLTIDLRSPSLGRRVVVRPVTDAAFGGNTDDKGAAVQSVVAGDLAARTATWDDRDVGLALLSVRLEPKAVDAEGRAVAIETGTPTAIDTTPVRLVFRPRVPELQPGTTWTRWSMRLMETTPETAPTAGASSPPPRRVVAQLEGTGAPPEILEWTGEGEDGRVQALLRTGRYFARMVVETDAGNIGISPDVPVVVGAAPPQVDAFASDVKDPALRSGKLSRTAKRALRKIASALKSTTGPITIGAHTDNTQTSEKALALSEQTANEARDLLVKRGIDVARVEARGFGTTAPLAPNITSRTRKRNRRIEIRITPPPVDVAFTAAVPRVVANGRAIDIVDGKFGGEVPASRSGEVTLMMKDAVGARAMIRLRPPPRNLWQGRASDLDAYAAERLSQRRGTEASTAMVSTATPDAGTDAGGTLASSMRWGDAGTMADGGAAVVATKSRAQQPVPYSGSGDAPSWWPTWSQVPAGDLELYLPSENTPLRSRRLFVRGRTAPTNTLRIMGQPVAVHPETGAFSHAIDLTKGPFSLAVETEDVLGNKAKINRLYEVDPSGWFFMLFAEAAAGQDGAQLAERSDTTSITLGDFFLYGRGVAYVKGDFQGDYVFKNYDLTFHADTRRWQNDVFSRDVFDVDRFMPLYGDSSIEVQDAQAYYPVYLDLKADHSSARIGNLKTNLRGGDLFQYKRSRYGVELELDRGWSNGLQLNVERDDVKIADPKSDPWRTTARVFGAGGAANTRHARIELLGTGGSIFFLRHEDIIEGSERVSVIVRDGTTGAEVARMPQARNADYTVRYGEGRLVFKEPIPAFVDAGFTVNHNLGQVTSGNRVFIEIEYDHNSLEAFQGLSAGGQIQQTFFGHLEVGGGYVYEGREDGRAAYQLAGMNTKLFYDANTFLKAEWAWSQSVDAGNFLSLDGGLTYQSLGQSLDQKPTQVGRIVFPAERQGLALKVEGQAAFGQLLGGAAQDGMVRGYAQYQSPGFFSGANIVEQGQTKWGLDVNWAITKNDAVRVRYDSVLSDIPEIVNVTQARALHRHLVTAGYTRTIWEGLKVGGELGYAYTWDSGVFGDASGTSTDVHTTIGALVVDWQLLDDLALSLKQEVILTGDERQLNQWNDHFVSHAQLRYALSDRVSLNVTESLRWSGENLTQVGLSWKVNDRARVYATERIGLGQAGWTNSTVIGGESEVVEGSKMYAEYQLTGALSGPQSRGVVGLANKWKLPFGFTLNFGYERTQSLGGDASTTSNGTIAPGAFTDGTFYAAPGANGGGSFLYGAGSRDAGWAGLEYKRGDTFIASQRFELRYDNFDESRGGADRLWAVSTTNATWKMSPELSFLARYNFALAQDVTHARQEARMEEGTLGVAYRPVTHDWVSVWAKLSRRADVRPLSLVDGRFEEYTTHAGSVEPIVELPFDIQLVEKLAIKHASQILDDLPRADALTVLWINRVNWHALRTIRRFGVDPIIPGDIDLGVEYRFLGGLTSNTLEHGLLVEATIAPMPFFRIGVGWNFTKFSDNELARNDRDYSGFFVRAVGQY